MNNTLIFAELLIVGLQAMIWVVLAVMTLLGKPDIHLDFIKGWAGVFTFVLLALAYGLGVVVDRIADSAFDHTDKKLRKEILIDNRERYDEMRYYIYYESEGLSKRLYYLRGRIRIARSTALNFFGITFCLLLYVDIPPYKILCNTSLILINITIIIFGIGIALFAISVWRRITRTWYQRIDLSYRLLSGK